MTLSHDERTINIVLVLLLFFNYDYDYYYLVGQITHNKCCIAVKAAADKDDAPEAKKAKETKPTKDDTDEVRIILLFSLALLR